MSVSKSLHICFVSLLVATFSSCGLLQAELTNISANLANTKSASIEEGGNHYQYQSEACIAFYDIAYRCLESASPQLQGELKSLMKRLDVAEQKGAEGLKSAERQCNMIMGGFACP